MNKSTALRKLEMLEAQAEMIINTVTVLKKELSGSSASGNSARKGVKESVKKKVNLTIARREARMKKANR